MGRFGASPPDGLKRQKVTRSHRTDEWTADLFSQERMYVGTTPVRRCVGCWSIASFRVANQLRRFGREPDTGSGGSRDLILDAFSANRDHKHLGERGLTLAPLLGRATVRNLPPTSISKFVSKGAPPPLGCFGRSCSIGVLPEGARKSRWSGRASRRLCGVRWWPLGLRWQDALSMRPCAAKY